MDKDTNNEHLDEMITNPYWPARSWAESFDKAWERQQQDIIDAAERFDDSVLPSEE